MKQYDNIMASNGDVTIIPNYMLSKNQFLLKGPFEQKSNVIVLTIEELREMFVHAEECGEDKFEARSIDKMFNDYLTSKGIQL